MKVINPNIRQILLNDPSITFVEDHDTFVIWYEKIKLSNKTKLGGILFKDYELNEKVIENGKRR